MSVLSALLAAIYISHTTATVDEYEMTGAVRGTYRRVDSSPLYTLRTPPLAARSSAHVTPLTTPRSIGTVGSSLGAHTPRKLPRSPKSQSFNHNTIKYISIKEDYLLFVTTTNNKTKWEIYANTAGSKGDKKYSIETQIGELPTSKSGWMSGDKRSAEIKRAPNITLSKFQIISDALKETKQRCQELEATIQHNEQVINETELQLIRKIAENEELNSLIIKYRDELQGKIDYLTLLLNVQEQELNVTQKELVRIIAENQVMEQLMAKERKEARERIGNLTLLVEEQTRKISVYQSTLDRRKDDMEKMDLLSLLVNDTRRLTEYEEEINRLRISGELVNVRRISEVDIGYNQTTEDDRTLMGNWNGLNVVWKITIPMIVIGDLCLIILVIYCCRSRELKEKAVMMENIHQMKKLELMQLNEILNEEERVNMRNKEANKSEKLVSDRLRDKYKDVLVENIVERARSV